MRKLLDRKGVALGYALMLMILIFAICTIITLTALTQFSASKIRKDNLERDRLCSEMGELFQVTGGQYVPSENSPFGKALEEYGFGVEVNSEDSWNVKSEKFEFLLTFSTENEGKVRTLTVQNVKGKVTYLQVKLDENGNITAWTDTLKEGE